MNFSFWKFVLHQWSRGFLAMICAIIPIICLVKFRFVLPDTSVVLIIGIILMGICGISILLAVMYMFRVLFDARNQKQFSTKEGMLVCLIVRHKEYPLYINLLDFQVGRTYCLVKISRINKGPFNIIIAGEIIVNMGFAFNPETLKTKKKFRLPRNFTNEEQILNIDIDEYNRRFGNIIIDQKYYYKHINPSIHENLGW